MPIYDYQCSSCGHKAEVMRKVSAASGVEACPKCGTEAFSKQLSAPSFQLSGSGWYATDFKGSSNKSASASTESPSEKKPDAAPAACGTGCGCH